jgi:hypothetical protein
MILEKKIFLGLFREDASMLLRKTGLICTYCLLFFNCHHPVEFPWQNQVCAQVHTYVNTIISGEIIWCTHTPDPRIV